MAPTAPALQALSASALLLLLAACAEPGPGGSAGETETSGDPGQETADEAGGEPLPLIDLQTWAAVDAADDPLADHRPEPVECGVAGIYAEGEELEINTNFCNYAMLEWPALAAIPAGSTLELEMRHYDLIAPAPATAHLALLVGDGVVWERLVTIPGPAAVLRPTILIAGDHPAETPIRLHLHNHGQNTWILTGITLMP